MKTMLRALIATTLIALTGTVLAAGEDLAACRWANGAPIEPKLCDHMQRKKAEERDRAATEQVQQQRIADEDRSQQAARAARQAEDEQRVRQAAAEQEAAQGALADQLARTRVEDEAEEARALALRETRRGECGSDFARPRVGMSMDRAQQCVGDFRLVSQVNRQDGVVSIYRAGRLMVHELGGRIAAWSYL